MKRALDSILEEIKRRGYKVNTHKTFKNGVERIGVIFGCDKKITPIIYTEFYVNLIGEGKSVEEVVDSMIQIYEEHNGEEIGDIKRLVDREFLLPRLRVGLQRTSKEEVLIQKTEYEGIDSYLYVSVNEQGFTFKISEKHLPILGVTKEEAFEIAKKQSLEECTIRAMSEVLSDMVGIEMEQDNGMFVVTNKHGFRGAVGILNKDMIRMKMKEVFGNTVKEVIILPSSIHECIVVPRTYGMDDLTVFDSMVREVNDNEVEEHEVLENRSYILKL